MKINSLILKSMIVLFTYCCPSVPSYCQKSGTHKGNRWELYCDDYKQNEGVKVNGKVVIPCTEKSEVGYTSIDFEAIDEYDDGWFRLKNYSSKKNTYYNIKGEVLPIPISIDIYRFRDPYDGSIFYGERSYSDVYNYLITKDFKEIYPYDWIDKNSSVEIKMERDDEGNLFYIIKEPVEGAGVKNHEGKWIVPKNKDFHEIEKVQTPSSGIFFIGTGYSSDGLYSGKGDEIIPHGMSRVKYIGGDFFTFDTGYIGVINTVGDVIIPTSRHYDYIRPYNSLEKRISFVKGDYEGECDHTGKQLSIVRRSTKASASKKPASSTNSSSSRNTLTSGKSSSSGGSASSASRASSSASSSSSNSKTNDSGLIYAGMYTQSPQGYCAETGEYTDGFGSGWEKEVKIYDDHIVVMGSACKFQSQSGKWKVYSDPLSLGGTRSYYYVDDNFNMKYVSVMDNPYTGGINTFSYSMEKGSVTFSIQQNQNMGGGSVGGGSASSRNSPSGSGRSSSSSRQHDLCNGTGNCNSCNGTGSIWRGYGLSGKTKCPNCGGSGKCRGCNGTGRR